MLTDLETARHIVLSSFDKTVNDLMVIMKKDYDHLLMQEDRNKAFLEQHPTKHEDDQEKSEFAFKAVEDVCNVLGFNIDRAIWASSIPEALGQFDLEQFERTRNAAKSIRTAHVARCQLVERKRRASLDFDIPPTDNNRKKRRNQPPPSDSDDSDSDSDRKT
jgi:hypothetical protein